MFTFMPMPTIERDILPFESVFSMSVPLILSPPESTSLGQRMTGAMPNEASAAHTAVHAFIIISKARSAGKALYSR